MRSALNLRREARWLWPISAIMVIAVLCAGYVLSRQRLESPLAERYGLNLEFAAVDGVKPETGSPVTVAGVSVGQIDTVGLEDGRGVLHVRIDPAKLPSVYEGARAVLVPNTPLKDMQIRLDPGPAEGRRLAAEATLPLRQTTSPVDSDELLRALDTDTRDWVRLLIHDMGLGVEGRKRDLNELLRALGPTATQMRELTDLLAKRRTTIRDVVANLRIVAEATADGEDELRTAVDAGNATLGAIASQDDALLKALELLPSSLDAVDGTLRRAAPFAGALRRSLAALDTPLERLPRTVRDLPDATRGLLPLPAAELAEFVDAAAPLGRHVRPASRDLGAAIEPLKHAFGVLTRTTNAMAHKPDDRQGYLFWLAWFANNVNSMLSTGDAQGSVIRGYVLMSCASAALSPALTDVLTSAGVTSGSCPEGGS